MNRQQKEAVISDFSDLFAQSEAAFLVKYKGISVADLQELRGNLREKGGTLKVTKARLMKLAAQNKKDEIGGLENFQEFFKDQVGLVFVESEISEIAKKLVDYSKDNEKLEIVSGLFESKVMTEADIKTLASLPSKDILLAMLTNTMQLPVMAFTRSLQMLLVQLAHSLEHISKQKAE